MDIANLRVSRAAWAARGPPDHDVLWSARVAFLLEVGFRLWARIAHARWLLLGFVIGIQASPVNLVDVLPSVVLCVPALGDPAIANLDLSGL